MIDLARAREPDGADNGEYKPQEPERTHGPAVFPAKLD
jgi:hypothetical protein